MNRVFLIAEADGEVGFGHLAELRAVASALRDRGVAAMRIAIGPASQAEPDVQWHADYDSAAARIAAEHPRAIAWSVRTDRWRSIWKRVEASRVRHLWIADLADDYPPVDALVVPTLEPKWREAAPMTRVLAGPSYFPLDLRGPRDVPPISSRSRDVLLTLGGADRTEASLRLLPALAGTKSTVVIGPAFKHRDKLERLAESLQVATVIAPLGLRDLLVGHRVVISAGGNTLFEAAAAGTPALVAWEDPHEEDQGIAFMKKGSARVLGQGAVVDVDLVKRSVKALLSSSDLERMSAAGRQLVDGRGADRIADVVLELTAGVAA